MESVRRNLSATGPLYMSFRVSGAAPEPVRAGILSADTTTRTVEPLANLAGTYSGRKSALAPSPASSLSSSMDEPDTLPPSHSAETAGRQVYSASSGASSLEGNLRFNLSETGRMHRVA